MTRRYRHIVLKNSPPAFAEAASRRQVAPLCQGGVIALFCQGKGGGIWFPGLHNYGLIKNLGEVLYSGLGVKGIKTPSALRGALTAPVTTT